MNNKDFQTNKLHLFRAYDIRGIFPEEINSTFFVEIGEAVTIFAKKKYKHIPHFYVGYDVRTTSPLLTFSLIAGILSNGAKITFSGEPFAFGVNLFSGFSHNVDITVFITASHLPPEWNGVKFYYYDGVGFSEEDLLKIRDVYQNNISFKEKKSLSWKDIAPVTVRHYYNNYKEFLKEKFSLSSSLKIIVDSGNGSTSLTAPVIFRECRYTVYELWCTIDPTFPNRSPEPDETSLGELKKLVKEKKANFGVGFDADGDRGVIIDELGHIISPEHIGIILTRFLIKINSKDFINKKPLILANVECSTILEKEFGSEVTVKRIKVGHTYLTLDAKKLDPVLGLESSGHFVFPKYVLFDDAMLIPLLIGKAMEFFGKSLNTLVSELGSLHKAKTTIRVDDRKKFGVINEFINRIKELESYEINLIDGVGIIMENGWALVRASNTSPLIRLTVEAESQGEAERIMNEFKKMLSNIVGS